jgi:hypothetical protein
MPDRVSCNESELWIIFSTTFFHKEVCQRPPPSFAIVLEQFETTSLCNISLILLRLSAMIDALDSIFLVCILRATSQDSLSRWKISN